jgi:hypothetical protein
VHAHLTLHALQDFGAVGDGTHDDASSFQAAIDASVRQGRALLVPAGTYAVSKTLVVPNTHTSGMQSLLLVGEGSRVATVKATTAMDSILFFDSSVPQRKEPPVAGVTTNGHEVRSIGFDGIPPPPPQTHTRIHTHTAAAAITTTKPLLSSP